MSVLQFPGNMALRRKTISALIPRWVADRRADGRRERGVQSYEDILYRFVDFSHDCPPAQVTLDMVRAYKRHLSIERQLAPGTVRNALTVLRSFLAWCVEEEILSENVALRVKHPKVPAPTPQPLTRDEVAQLLAALDAPQRSHRSTWQRNRRAICLMLYAGLRLNETAGLEWRDVDLERREITVRADIAKGGSARMVPICDELLAELVVARWRLPNYAVVDQGDTRQSRGKHIAPKSLAHIFERWLPRRGLHIHAHQLRKTFATELYLRGEDLVTIQRLLGHRDPKTTMRYIGASAAKERQAVQRLTFRSDICLDFRIQTAKTDYKTMTRG